MISVVDAVVRAADAVLDAVDAEPNEALEILDAAFKILKERYEREQPGYFALITPFDDDPNRVKIGEVEWVRAKP